MDVDEDDDFYAPEESTVEVTEEAHAAESTLQGNAKPDPEDDDLEEGEEEDESISEGSDSV